MLHFSQFPGTVLDCLCSSTWDRMIQTNKISWPRSNCWQHNLYWNQTILFHSRVSLFPVTVFLLKLQPISPKFNIYPFVLVFLIKPTSYSKQYFFNLTLSKNNVDYQWPAKSDAVGSVLPPGGQKGHYKTGFWVLLIVPLITYLTEVHKENKECMKWLLSNSLNIRENLPEISSPAKTFKTLQSNYQT